MSYLERASIFLMLLCFVTLGIGFFFALHSEKEFEENAVVLNGIIKDKVVNEGNTFISVDPAMLASTGVPMTTTEKGSDDYFLIVDVENKEYKVSTSSDAFNSKKVGQKVKLKKYKDEIKLAN
ncbi:hypothetical protein [Bacillus licheniformis]|uniref:hypothetical protein n=1 Tax=Bacillus licheniformis TaxID=1402 RepID=UPI002E205C76|nr:hypothetical protein [Bacillus licheniformis]